MQHSAKTPPHPIMLMKTLESRDTDLCTAQVAGQNTKPNPKTKSYVLCSTHQAQVVFPISTNYDPGMMGVWRVPLNSELQREKTLSPPSASTAIVFQGQFILHSYKPGERNISANLPGDLEQSSAGHFLTIQQFTHFPLRGPPMMPKQSPTSLGSQHLSVTGTASHTGGFLIFHLCHRVQTAKLVFRWLTGGDIS